MPNETENQIERVEQILEDSKKKKATVGRARKDLGTAKRKWKQSRTFYSTLLAVMVSLPVGATLDSTIFPTLIRIVLGIFSFVIWHALDNQYQKYIESAYDTIFGTTAAKKSSADPSDTQPSPQVDKTDNSGEEASTMSSGESATETN